MTVDLADVPENLREPVAAALAAAKVEDGHLSVEVVGAERIRFLNREHRGRDETTDVLSFPVDGIDPTAGPRELGDVVLHPPDCDDLTEAVVHGVLHLCGYDHETDEGEMLAVQTKVMAELAAAAVELIPPRPRSRSGPHPETRDSAGPRSRVRARRSNPGGEG